MLAARLLRDTALKLDVTTVKKLSIDRWRSTLQLAVNQIVDLEANIDRLLAGKIVNDPLEATSLGRNVPSIVWGLMQDRDYDIALSPPIKIGAIKNGYS